ncbi:hypothetical protein CSHISOI_09620, partial [Colletotrichum shisoi]
MVLKFFAALFVVWAAPQAEALLDHEQNQAVRDLRNSSQPLVQSTCMVGSDLCIPTSATRYPNTTITQGPSSKTFRTHETATFSLTNSSRPSQESPPRLTWANASTPLTSTSYRNVPWTNTTMTSFGKAPTTISKPGSFPAESSLTSLAVVPHPSTISLQRPRPIPSSLSDTPTSSGLDNIASDADANGELDSGYQYHTHDAYSASLFTVTGITLTTPHYVTTTSPGGSDPTIVPIIFPFTGPPLICFGCFKGFPPNIAIKLPVPQFCIRLLGLRIGNCPTDDKKGDKDGGKDDGKDDDKEDDKDEDDDDKKSSKASSATSTTTTSSCTVTVTATHQTVFCSITRSVKDGTRTYTDAKTTCLTSAYTTIAGCSVLNSVATVTTIRTSDPRPSDPLCGPGCGNGACQAFQPPASAAADAARPQKPERRSAGPNLLSRGEPSRGEWRDPADYPGGYHEFMEMEFDYMRRRMNFGLSHHQPKLVLDGPPMPNERESLTTVRSNWVLFRDKVETLAIEGLVGCTVVVVISDRGAWMGKFYEETISDATLFAEALSGWRTGRQAQDDWTKYARYGIDDLRNHPERRDIGEVFGSDDDAVAFPVRILVITPRRRVVEPDEGRSAGPPVQLDYEGGGMPVYPQVRRIVDDILEAIPQRYHDESLVRFYPQEQLTEEERYHRENGELSDLYWSNTLQDRILHTAQGKVMLQYQPAGRCTDDASWRIWVDQYPLFRTTPDSQFLDEWSALDGQFFSDQLRPQYPGELYSRQECPIKGKPAPGGGSMSSVSPSLATSAGQGMPGGPATLSGSGGRTQSLPPGSSYANGTAAPLPWNSSLTTHVSGSGSVTKPSPTSYSSPTASQSWNGTMLPTVGGSATATLGSARLPSNATATGIANTGTPVLGASSSRSSVSIFTTIYVAGPPIPLSSSKPTTSSSAPPLKRVTVTVTASVQRSVVKTVTVVTATVIVPAGPTPSTPSEGPKPGQEPRVSFGPKKSEAVYVMHEEVMAGGSETIAVGEMLIMFPVTVDSTIEHCEVQRLGWKLMTFGDDRSWPPSMEARDGREAFGRKKCAYKAKQDGFGSLKCEGVGEFNCFKDADYDKTFS